MRERGVLDDVVVLAVAVTVDLDAVNIQRNNTWHPSHGLSRTFTTDFRAALTVIAA